MLRSNAVDRRLAPLGSLNDTVDRGGGLARGRVDGFRNVASERGQSADDDQSNAGQEPRFLHGDGLIGLALESF